MKAGRTIHTLKWALCILSLCVSTAWAKPAQPYLVGRGMSDITGPAFGMQLWGFGRADQLGEGIHIRQRARAFVIAQADAPQHRLAFVSADLGSVEHHITLEVVERLQARLGDDYRLDNVIISATHTHSGPGGYWHSRTDTGLDGGFYPEHFEMIVSGITAAIVQAHEDLQPGEIRINKGQVNNAGANRSLIAYEQNPQQERQRYAHNTPTQMTLLKFSDDSGDIGVINWYALHPTAMNFYNRLISGDHKGYASLQMEQEHGAQYGKPGNFVAAFAQSDPGDVTPNMNLDNTGPGETDVETTRIMGQRQLDVARTLYEQATEVLRGPVDSRQVYIDFSNYEISDKFTGAGVQHTCPSAYGYSFAGGSSEDGGANFLFYEGMTEQKMWRDALIRLVTGAPAWTEAVHNCQAPKPILFETGSQQPPLQSQIRSVTVARIGQLVILALPTEVTTMAGRRLRESVMQALGDWAQHIVLAGYANGYAGYVTTPQEYQLQQYEGAHTLHGQWSLPAYRQVASQLASALEQNTVIDTHTDYDDWRGKSDTLELPGVHASDSNGHGEFLALSQQSYTAGDTAVARFRSTHPNRHYRNGNSFLAVQQQTPDGWREIASDSDWQTRVRWRRDGDTFIARLSWDIPATTGPGVYRLVHRGFDHQGAAFEGVSDSFDVKQP